MMDTHVMTSSGVIRGLGMTGIVPYKNGQPS